MKRAHRRAHVWMWLLIAPLVAAGAALALIAKPSLPVAAPDDRLLDGSR